MSSKLAPLTEGSVEGNARRPDKHSLTVVGIGGSAGGLPALIKLLERLEATSSLAFVVVLHLAPDQESHAAEILLRFTSLVVVQVKDRTRLEPGYVYVIALGTNLITDDGHVQPSANKVTRPSFVIDLFFRTLGEVHQEHAVGLARPPSAPPKDVFGKIVMARYGSRALKRNERGEHWRDRIARH